MDSGSGRGVGVGGEGVWLTQFVVTEVNVLHSCQLDKQLSTKKRKFTNRYLLNFQLGYIIIVQNQITTTLGRYMCVPVKLIDL